MSAALEHTYECFSCVGIECASVDPPTAVCPVCGGRKWTLVKDDEQDGLVMEPDVSPAD